MCDECKRSICAPACPNSEHALAGRGRAADICKICGIAIFHGEKYYRRGDVAVCADCEMEMTLDELRLLCAAKEVLPLLGFERII